MAEQLGRGSYTKKEKSGLSSQAQGGLAPGLNQGTPQGGGGGSSMFSGYGDASKSKYDDSMVNSLVNFVGKINEAQVQRNMEEQQLFGMQAAAKGISLDEVKKTQPGLSKFFGDTFVLEGARVYTGQDNANKMTLAIEQNWEEWKKLSPDQMRAKYMEVSDMFKTGDTRTDTTMLATSMQNFGKLSAKHYTDNFEWQQDKLMGAYTANATTKAVQFAKDVENESDPDVLRQKGEAFGRSLVAEMPPTISDDRKAKVLEQVLPKLTTVPGGTGAISAIVSDIGASQPEVLGKNPGFVGLAVTTATNLKAIGAQRMVEHQPFREAVSKLKLEVTNNQAKAEQAQTYGTPEEVKFFTDKRDAAQAQLDRYTQGAGLDVDLTPAKNQNDIDLIFRNRTYQDNQAAAAAAEKENSSRYREAMEITARNDIRNAPEDKKAEVAMKHILAGNIKASTSDEIIQNNDKKIDALREKYFVKEDFDNMNSRRFRKGERDLTRDEYIDGQIAEEKKKEEKRIAEVSTSVADQKAQESAMRQARLAYKTLAPDGSNVSDVAAKMMAAGWAEKTPEARSHEIDVAFLEAKTEEEVEAAIQFAITNHYTNLPQAEVNTRVLPKTFRQALANRNLGEIAKNLKVFQQAQKYTKATDWIQQELGGGYDDWLAISQKYPQGFGDTEIKVINEDIDKIVNNVKPPKPLVFEKPTDAGVKTKEGNYKYEDKYPFLIKENEKSNLRNREGYAFYVHNMGKVLDEGDLTKEPEEQYKSAQAKVNMMVDTRSSASNIYRAPEGASRYGKTMEQVITGNSRSTGYLPNPQLFDRVITDKVKFDTFSTGPVLKKGEKIVSRDGDNVTVSGPSGSRVVTVNKPTKNNHLEPGQKLKIINVYYNDSSKSFTIEYLDKGNSLKRTSMTEDELNFRYGMKYQKLDKDSVENNPGIIDYTSQYTGVI